MRDINDLKDSLNTYSDSQGEENRSKISKSIYSSYLGSNAIPVSIQNLVKKDRFLNQ
jgi:hypothetical protein